MGRAETEIGSVLICAQVVAKLVCQGETPPAAIGRAVDKRDADIINSDIATVYYAWPEI